MRYAATATIAILAVSSWEWGLPLALAIGLAIFWPDILSLVDHNPARVAWLLFHSGEY